MPVHKLCRFGALLSGVLTVFAASPASALSLRWHVPEGCAPESIVRQRIEQTLGPRASDPSLVVQVDVTRDGEDWLLSVGVLTIEGTSSRTLRATSCEPLVEGAAVMVAALLPPEELSGDDAPTPVPPEPRRVRLDGSLLLLAERGALPGLTAGLAPGLELSTRRWRLGLTVSGFLPREADLSALPQARTQVTLWTLAVSSCLDLPYGRISLLPCVDFEGGQLWAHETGLARGRSRSTPWIAPGLGFGLDLTLSPHWSLIPQFQAFFPLRRARIDVGPSGAELLIHEPSAVSIRVGLNLSMRLWGSR